jgi:hypothetical protein
VLFWIVCQKMSSAESWACANWMVPVRPVSSVALADSGAKPHHMTAARTKVRCSSVLMSQASSQK